MDFSKQTVHSVIFEAETKAGKLFDVTLIVVILASVISVFLDTIRDIHDSYGDIFYVVEWVFTIFFTIEYCLRLWCINNRWLYARSFFGVVDLLGTLPTYLSLFFVGAQYLLVIRIIRVLRVFRILRLMRFVGEAELLMSALRASRRKITVFFLSVLTMVVVFGSLMYMVEGEEHGFTSIPESIYWAVVTLTTVGFGDIIPQTPLGKALASLVMVMGYAVIAVPTGIFAVEMSQAERAQRNTRTCPHCAAEGHSMEASYCWRCGSHLYPVEESSQETDGT